MPTPNWIGKGAVVKYHKDDTEQLSAWAKKAARP